MAAASELLNESDIAIVQHEYGIYGGVDGDEVVDIIGGLRIPSIVVAHTVLKTRPRISVLCLRRSRRQRLGWLLCRRRPGNACASASTSEMRSGRTTLLTWGLLGPGKGIERVIEAMGSLRELHGRPRYLVAGRTHPKVWPSTVKHTARPRAEQARRTGVADSVCFDAHYRNVSSLTALVRSSALVSCPTTPRIRSLPVFWSTQSQRAAGRRHRAHAEETISAFRSIAERTYAVEFAHRTTLSERILWPSMGAEQGGMEDARFVRFIDDDGSVPRTP
ncbi:hypothetical protein MMAN_30530 [Mycobacterium mantenii]|uniref:Glycosyl transferase family 1 domain-containing protein n=1 Tax=Mycobacterium mantenii TaxID=560555 RepID=A0A1X0G3C4_MYCNT|nr:hypothetical protein [Mycobacterium mantenii]MCV7244052.1 glycosyl transferase family 1 [Mycobacterium mantenii]ORB08531.1 hypothetical protein BST30_04525 [Mycobacterium mantenii]BBY38919.1 hypothetical protein MMAN_30530 [Mycobacterium mantenii]